MSQRNSQFYLSSDQQDLLVAALNSNQPNAPQDRSSSGPSNQNPKQRSASSTNLYDSTFQNTPGSGQLDGNMDESPYLDFDGEFDDSYNFDLNGDDMIGDLPPESSTSNGDNEHELHEKRKSVGGKDADDEGGGKRREGEDKAAKKPGRKPLTSEPTSKRKAQNRAAQRAFRDRKEKHLRDLETKVESLEKASESTNHENGLLRAQVERLQVELKEYRKRLSWVSNGGGLRKPGPSDPALNPVIQNKPNGNKNDFQFDFPRFGDLPSSVPGNGSSTSTTNQAQAPNRSTSLPSSYQSSTNQKAYSGPSPNWSTTLSYPSASNSPHVPKTTSPISQQDLSAKPDNFDSFGGLFSPSILAASRNFENFPQSTGPAVSKSRPSTDSYGAAGGQVPSLYSKSSVSNSDSPGSSVSQPGAVSTDGTSPGTSLSSPNGTKLNDFGLNTISENNQTWPTQTFGTNVPPGNDFNWLVQQNGGNFDPVLFNDYREPQDAIIGQDFGSFFNEAFPLPDLGSPLHNFSEVANLGATSQKGDLMKQVDAVQNGEDESTANSEQQSKMLTCNKIWDRLQSMEKFRNGEIDVDNLCSELRAKARCSEGSAVVEKNEVDKILKSAK